MYAPKSKQWEEDRASLYAIMPMRDQNGLTAEQVKDLKNMQSTLSSDEQESKERMIRVITNNDRSLLYHPRVRDGTVMETDLIHESSIGDPQPQPSQAEMAAPPSFNYLKSLQTAIQNAEYDRKYLTLPKSEKFALKGATKKAARKSR